MVKNKRNMRKEDPKNERWSWTTYALIALSFFIITYSLWPENGVSLFEQPKQTYIIDKPDTIKELGGFYITRHISNYKVFEKVKLKAFYLSNRFSHKEHEIQTNPNGNILHVIERRERDTISQERIDDLFRRLKRETLFQLGLTESIKPHLWGVDGKAILINGNIRLELGYIINNNETTTLYAIVEDFTLGNRSDLQYYPNK